MENKIIVDEQDERALLNLDSTGKGTPAGNLHNAIQVLQCDPKLKNHVWFDEFLQKIMTGDPAREWRDADDLELTIYMQRDAGISRMSREIASQAVIAMAHRNVRNCVRDWMDSLVWDREPRIDHCFEDHFGVNGNPYVRAASRNLWLSMTARAYRPGCQCDSVIVLEGAQGSRKSSVLRVIGGPYYTEQHESITGRGFFETLQGKLVVEISEMDAFSRGEMTKVKAVITCTSDRFRESYGRHSKDHPRQCIFVGTTNHVDWNRDETGARRFWPIRCEDIDVDAVAASRDQLFAEAVVRYKSNESWWEMPDEETRYEQDARYTEDVWNDDIAEYIRPRAQVLVKDILVDSLNYKINEIGKREEMRVSTCLHRLGWERKTKRIDGKVTKMWEPK